MIMLDGVTLFRPGSKQRELILEDATQMFGPRSRIGILAAQGTGRSTLARTLCGIQDPDQGRVTRQGATSWPLGFAGFLHPFLTISENLDYIAKLCGMPPLRMVAFCADFIGDAFNESRKVQDLAPAERQLLAYACSVAPRWANYIADETVTVGDETTRERCEALLTERTKGSTLIVLSRNLNTLRKYTDEYFVILRNKLVASNDLDVAAEALNLTRAEKTTVPETGAEGSQDA